VSAHDVDLPPAGMAVVVAKAEDGEDISGCVSAGHVFCVSRVLADGVAAVDGFAVADAEMRFVVRNLGDADLRLAPRDPLFAAACTFNENEFGKLWAARLNGHLLGRSKFRCGFYDIL
jgi:hypothetical protein